MEARDTILATYDRLAAKLSAQYDTTSIEQTFPHLATRLPRLKALDVGCGNGRDAEWLAKQGYTVRAIDGSEGMLAEARFKHSHERITYGHDLLPELASTRAKGESYDLILLSAVWMHIHPTRRAEALDNLMSLANPGALILMSLRHGTVPADRPMFEVSPQELQQLSAPRLMHFEHVPNSAKGADTLGRSDVWWEDVYLRLPATHVSGLATIRHDILGSRMNSPHKPVLLLALQRALSQAPVEYPTAASLAVSGKEVVRHWQALYGDSSARALGVTVGDTPSRAMKVLLQGPLAHLTEAKSGKPLFTMNRDSAGSSWLALPRTLGEAIAAHGPLVTAGAVAKVDAFLEQRRAEPVQASRFSQHLRHQLAAA